MICRVTGKNLIYSIIPNLPYSTLKFDKSSGIISGYISKSFKEVNSTVLISGSGKQVSFNFMLMSVIIDEPRIIPSSIIPNISLIFGEEMKNVYLFVAVGSNLKINVNPSLPKGLYLDNKSGEIYGLANEYIEKAKYNFTIENPPSVKVESVIVEIELEGIYCENDDEFPRSLAMIGGNEILIDCGSSKKGMKKRRCILSDDRKGIWSEIDDSECELSDGVIIGIAVGSVAVGLLLIVVIVILLLRSGLFGRHRVRTESRLKKIPIIDEKVESEEGIRV